MTERERCYRCNEPLNPARTTYLEFNIRTGAWSDPDASGPLPAAESQGCFPFGRACAATVLRTQREAEAQP